MEVWDWSQQHLDLVITTSHFSHLSSHLPIAKDENELCPETTQLT
jgi:hypothetical protein